ncbi:AI-2E family transporter [Melissococcus plutonius]|uniref:Membrane protein n=1 Tax=Melissococcus plutonius (strain ATCC 35311 / DSM 29964 / CIP 104052 / LMG 20360 / NCIMB 702443) TaxID=940190 RepID=F3YAW3_MELPT|nr:AI-2E family transporter [Melissococcus plutonius]KMT32431.1 putative permease [Melissococcus plutonius]KMT33950.1 putative permease [Melissococcus plutonius]KMT39937.1 putative permease [Melissococcus plutonius]MBB5178448.1 putative PurR-regulated permease PerM [Melissococcus plutonius]BAK21641.1 membrane protein [Melissococcus plutonius ATCC 35311]
MKKETKWIQFLGGKGLIFTLVVFLLIGSTISIFQQISFIFHPLQIIFKIMINPVIFALILYYLFNPLVNYLEHHGIKRTYSVSGIFIISIGLISLGIIALVPILEEQVKSLSSHFPKYVDNFTHSTIQFFKNSPVEEPIRLASTRIQTFTNAFFDRLGSYYTQALAGVSVVFSTLTTVALTMITAPFIAFFLLKDDHKFFESLLAIIPPRFREDSREIGKTINNQVGAYLKGQVIVSITVGFLTFLGFLLIQMPYTGTLSMITGFLAIIPYVGPIVAFIPSAIIAIISSLNLFIRLCVVWMIVQSLNGHFISPQVMGKNLVVHPLTIIVILLVMGDLLGIFGLLFGIPMYVLIKICITYLFKKFKQRYNNYYGEIAPYEKTDFSKKNYLDKQ